MATVREILSEKGSHVLCIGEDCTALDAAILMNEHKIGGLAVLRNGKVVGMFTERDLLQRVVAERLDPAKQIVSNIMTEKITVAGPGTTIDEARALMKNKRIRHLPIVDEERQPLGMISIGDLNAYQLVDHERTVGAMREYINGNGSTVIV